MHCREYNYESILLSNRFFRAKYVQWEFFWWEHCTCPFSVTCSQGLLEFLCLETLRHIILSSSVCISVSWQGHTACSCCSIQSPAHRPLPTRSRNKLLPQMEKKHTPPNKTHTPTRPKPTFLEKTPTFLHSCQDPSYGNHWQLPKIQIWICSPSYPRVFLILTCWIWQSVLRSNCICATFLNYLVSPLILFLTPLIAGNLFYIGYLPKLMAFIVILTILKSWDALV